MKSALCKDLGIEFPLFAFSHCRDVVAAVTNAGGMGVLGAVGHTPQSLSLAFAMHRQYDRTGDMRGIKWSDWRK